jgi:cyanophycinase-like exopeptidase
MRNLYLSLLMLLSGFATAQTYTSFFTGDPADVSTPVKGGVVLMGGATENDNAMRWFLNQTGGGDIVVLRASGADGYNAYLYSQLGVSVNSVETIITTTLAAAQDPYVAQQVRNAEGLWIAGGDQANYVNFWKNGAVEDAINYLIEVKKAPVGGTSAGMAIMGNAYFAALNGSVTSNVALNNPYNSAVTIGYNDFLRNPRLTDVITDTHYDSPDRRGRHTAFLARMTKDYGFRAKGIASEEYTAVCVDSAGLARVYGGYPASNDYAYFVQVNCETPYTPETCVAGQKLNWVRNNRALKVYKVPGTQAGTYQFNLNDWVTGTGGVWQHWWVSKGAFKTGTGTPPACAAARTGEAVSPAQKRIPAGFNITVSPNPIRDGKAQIRIKTEQAGAAELTVLEETGRVLVREQVQLNAGENRLPIEIPAAARGILWVRLEVEGQVASTKLLLTN